MTMVKIGAAERTKRVEWNEAANAGGAPVRDKLLEGLLTLCRLYDRPASASELTAGLPLADGRLTPGLVRRAAARADLDVRVRPAMLQDITAALLPALVIGGDGTVAVLLKVEGDKCTVLLPEMDAREVEMEIDTLSAQGTPTVVFAAPMQRSDTRADVYTHTPKGHWFWGEVKRNWTSFLKVALAAAIANLLAVASSLYAMQIYDRVVPNLAFATLWVLTAGALLAIGLEAMVRIVRAKLMDIAGRKMDLRLSSRIFEKAIGLRLEAQPRSTGSFTNQVREFDAVREFFTSTTIGALSDMPFLFLFVGIIALIGGPVAFVLIAAIPLIVIPGLIAQWPLARLSQEHMKEGSIRNGLLIEAMSGAETVKTTQSEGRFQRLWEEYSALIVKSGMRSRTISSALTFGATAVQQGSYVMVMVVGVHQIAAGNMTVGALLACAILSSRTIAPLTQLAGIFSRWQNMRAALSGIDKLMEAPCERPAERKFVHRPRLQGNYVLQDIAFDYDETSNAALQVPSFSVAPGSKIALLGANGSGKTTLLKILAGLYHPSRGQLLLDGTDIRQIDPADVRRSVAYLSQDVRLFYGTLRDNLKLGMESVEDEDLLEALAFVGAHTLVQEHPLGLDRMIAEGGGGISGGQRQSIGLARLWLRDPRIVLLDEPTAAIDQATEVKLIKKISHWTQGRTLIVATHRRPVLDLVERAVVLKSGRIAADGPVSEIVAALSGSSPARGD